MLMINNVLLSMLFLAGAPQEGEDPFMAAYRAFEASDAATKKAVIQEINRRVEESGDEALGRMLELRDRARRELKIERSSPPKYHDPDVWAPGLYRRRFVDPKSSDASMKRGIYRPWESEPPFFVRIRYDFGRDAGLDSGKDPSPGETLLNLLYGYPPGSDVLVAWLEKKWDFDSAMDAPAGHFSHVYCDLGGNAYADVTIYDALASGERMDMPDVDVIPYARRILKDDSYVSPIPPDARRLRLYEEIKEGFLKYFRYRTWIEAAANLYVSPEAELRPEHEPLRARLLYAFALDGGNVDRIRSRLVSARERSVFIRQIDKLAIKDPAEKSKTREFTSSRNEAKWAVAKAAHEVLREHGLLKDEE